MHRASTIILSRKALYPSPLTGAQSKGPPGQFWENLHHFHLNCFMSLQYTQHKTNDCTHISMESTTTQHTSVLFHPFFHETLWYSLHLFPIMHGWIYPNMFHILKLFDNVGDLIQFGCGYMLLPWSIYPMYETLFERSGVFQYVQVASYYLYGALLCVHAQLCDMYHPIKYPVRIRFRPSHIEDLNWCNSHPWSWLLMCRSSHRQSSLQQLFPPIPFPGPRAAVTVPKQKEKQLPSMLIIQHNSWDCIQDPYRHIGSFTGLESTPCILQRLKAWFKFSVPALHWL